MVVNLRTSLAHRVVEVNDRNPVQADGLLEFIQCFFQGIPGRKRMAGIEADPQGRAVYQLGQGVQAGPQLFTASSGVLQQQLRAIVAQPGQFAGLQGSRPGSVARPRPRVHHHILNAQYLGFGEVVGQAEDTLLPELPSGGQIDQIRGMNNRGQATQVLFAGSEAFHLGGSQAAGFPATGALGKNLNSAQAQQTGLFGGPGNPKFASYRKMKTVFQSRISTLTCTTPCRCMPS